MKLNIFLKAKLLSLFLVTVFLAITTINVKAQTIRYQQNIRGGATLIGTSWYYSDVVPAFNSTADMKVPHADPTVTPSTAISTYSDLILPAGSTIVKAYLSVERTASAVLTSVDLKVPGASSYTTINSTNWGALNHVAKNLTGPAFTFYQDYFDITSLMPTSGTGYATTLSGSSSGRYYVAKPTPAPNTMGGWSIIVVYSNPSSKYRSVTVTDNWQVFGISGATSINTDVSGVRVPSSGSVKAVVGVTGTYGDRGTNYEDYLNFGPKTGTLTALLDPSPAGTTDNALNSSVAMTANNNVSADIIAAGGTDYFMGGTVNTRNPISKGHYLSNINRSSESWEYDADIFDASGVLTPSITPIDVRLQQSSLGADILASGSYFISVDLATEATLTKTISPTTIVDGGTSTYTWTVTNTSADVVTLNNLGFTDNLPTSIKVAAIPNIVTTGTGSATITANAGSGTVTLSNLTLASGAVATIKVNVTNVPGQTNSSCSGSPSPFTNSAANITGTTGGIITTTMTSACLIVTPACTAGTSQVPLTGSTLTNTCPATTVNLNSLFTGTAPGVSNLVWFTNAAHTGTAYPTPTAATAGTYYAFFYDAAANCYNTTVSTSSVVVTINPCTDLTIHKEGVPSVLPGATTTYILLVSNNGSVAATNVVVQDPAVANFTATGVTATAGTGSPGTATVPSILTIAALQGSGLVIPSLPAQSTMTFVITGTAGTDGNSIINTATVTPPSNINDLNTANNTSTYTTTINVACTGVQSLYTFQPAATVTGGGTIGANGGTINLIYNLTSGPAITGLGTSFTVPMTYSDFKQNFTGVNHVWDKYSTSTSPPTALSLVPDEQMFYNSLPVSNNSTMPNTSPTNGDASFATNLNNSNKQQLGTFDLTFGSIPAIPSNVRLVSAGLIMASYFNYTTNSSGVYQGGWWMRPIDVATSINGPVTSFITGSFGNTYTFRYTAFTGTSKPTEAGDRGAYIIPQNLVFCTPCSSPPTATTTQTICATVHSTLANIAITGTDIKWYADATTSTAIPSTTALVNGTTYYATQNTGTCESTRVPVTVTLQNCSWVNPSLRFKGSK